MNKAFELILERLEVLIEKSHYEAIEGSNNAGIRNNEYHKVKKIVQEVAEEYEDGWIPCSERLPDVEEDVLLSLRSLDICTGFRANKDGCFYIDGVTYDEYENVIAWQPLPEPYKEKE